MPADENATAPSSSPDTFWEPAEGVTVEEKIKRSLFIAALLPCRGAEAVRSCLGEVSTQHKNATHNCWGYCLEDGTEHCSDDGEPSGTAGKPILAAIKRSGMVNLLVVVTRYYGGIKLGVRGLIEAYGQVAEAAASQVQRIARVRSRTVHIRLPYPAIGDITHLLNLHGAVGSPEWIYNAEVEVCAALPVSSATPLASALNELHARGIILSWRWKP